MSEEDQITASKFRRLAELREARDIAKVTAETTDQEYREYEQELYDELEESPIKGARRIDLGPPYGEIRFTPRETFYGRIIDVDKALEYFEEHGLDGDLTKPSFVKRRLNEIIRDRMDRGESLPPGTDFYANRGITITRLN
jgi:hypothetical protein